MKLVTVAMLAGAVLLSGCEGQTEENIGAAIQNEIPGLTNDLGNLAEDAENGAEQVGEFVGNQARSVANELDGNDANTSANTNEAGNSR